jgi:hypothetical protein
MIGFIVRLRDGVLQGFCIALDDVDKCVNGEMDAVVAWETGKLRKTSMRIVAK